MPHKRQSQAYLCKFGTSLGYIESSRAARTTFETVSKVKNERKQKVHTLESEMPPSGMYIADIVTSTKMKFMQWHSLKFHFNGLRAKNT